MKVLLIDADMLLFRWMSALSDNFCLGNEMWVWQCELDLVRRDFWGSMDEFQKKFETDKYFLCWTGPSAFRKRLFPDYKKSRKGSWKPPGYAHMKSELVREINTSILHDEIEADDLLGILADNVEETPVIVSGDKDLDQIPGEHYWPWKDDPHWIVSADKACRMFWTQALSGDSTDSIPGCPGIGAVGAGRLVDSMEFDKPAECWDIVVNEYEKQMTKRNMEEDPESYALLNARCVRILRGSEYDFKNRTVDLWTPPTLTF